jgi:predicted Zn finger-like uncharacterized protein
MNVSCPKCQSVFRVDPAKVPARGVRARCSVCAGVFFVGPEAGSPEAPAVTASVAAPPPVHVMAPPPPAVVVPVAMPVAAPLATPPVAPPLRTPVVPLAAPPVATPAPPAVSPPASRPVPQVATISPAPRAAPPVAPPVTPPAAPASAPRRATNPFLSQDPATRARRLARALISDLVVYYPAKRAEGLRDGTLKLLFEEDIRKCWEEYSEQVGMEMATSTRYFTEALNEILADGQPVFT